MNILPSSSQKNTIWCIKFGYMECHWFHYLSYLHIQPCVADGASILARESHYVDAFWNQLLPQDFELLEGLLWHDIHQRPIVYKISLYFKPINHRGHIQRSIVYVFDFTVRLHETNLVGAFCACFGMEASTCIQSSCISVTLIMALVASSRASLLRTI